MIGKFKKNTAGLDTRKIILKLAPPLKNAINPMHKILTNF